MHTYVYAMKFKEQQIQCYSTVLPMANRLLHIIGVDFFLYYLPKFLCSF